MCAQNLTESRGYASWLANNGVGSPPGAPAYDERAPWDESFLNYGVRFSMASDMTGHREAVLRDHARSEEHTSDLKSLMRISYAVFCLNNKKTPIKPTKQTDAKS